MIDIIIPAYNAHDTIKRTLYSILTQSIKENIKVLIVDDCSDQGYDDEIKDISKLINITIIRTPENLGPGFARQYGMEHSESEYIIFLDADDMFYNCFSVEQLYNFINENNFNAVCSDFLEECENSIIRHGFNDIWMHGKIYRRNFIEKNSIKFNNTLANEDTGFNHIISLIDEFKYLEDITYIWKYNYKSITRRNNYEYTFNSLDGYIYNICYSIEEALKKNANIEKVSKLIIGTMYEMYFNYLKYIKYEKVNNIFIWSKKIKELFLIYNTKISNYDKKKVVEEEFYKRIGNLDIIDYLNNRITFDDFLNSIDCENISNEIII